jgi:hypothetical protein
LVCPICRKRKASRFCPAKGENICSVCCATEREVTIDCPSDCPYLVASREYDEARKQVDWSKIPFGDVKLRPASLADHTTLWLELSFAIVQLARENPSLADPDIVPALQALAESYRTLSSGIYYEKPPERRIERELYERLKAAIEKYKQAEARATGVSTLRDSTIRDMLISMTQMGAIRSNGRPRGRAYLDLLRKQFKPEEAGSRGAPERSIVLP